MKNTKNTEETMKKRGQSAIEFIIIFGVVLVFFVLFLSVIKNKQYAKEVENENVLFQNLVLDVRDEINIAAGASEGYYREFDVPENVRGKAFEINITDDHYVYLRTEDNSFSFKTANVNGTIKKGVNFIRKNNGTVYLNK